MIGEKQTQFEDIVFTWEWDGLDISLFKFTGKIEGNKIRSKSYCPERDLRKYIKNVFQDKWNVMNETYLVVINELDDKAKESFKYSFKTKYLDFEVEVKDIDIAPISKEDARSWRDWLVLKELEKDYCSINDLKSVYEAINNKAVFEEGNYSLNLPSYSDCVQALVNKDKRIATQSKAFWHISAPKDLYIINNQVETHEN
jgi:hypothetical protein